MHGVALMDGHEHEFITQDISVDGAQISINSDYIPEAGIPIEIRINELEIRGSGKVCWVKPDKDKARTNIGIEFTAEQGLAGVLRLLSS